jgi:hypothetical protein
LLLLQSRFYCVLFVDIVELPNMRFFELLNLLRRLGKLSLQFGCARACSRSSTPL